MADNDNDNNASVLDGAAPDGPDTTRDDPSIISEKNTGAEEQPSQHTGSDQTVDVIDLPLETQKEIAPEPDAPAADPIADYDNDDDAPALADSVDDAQDAGEPQQKTATRKRTFPDGISGPIVVDASDHVAGRLSSHVAKLLLQGKRVSLVNCERIMISGTRSNTIHEYRQFLKINSIINPKHGPVHYRRPDTVITKMIRGMLPFEKKPSGKTAHKRLRAYIGSPRNLRPFKRIQFEKAKIRRPASTYTTMGEMCRVIGWTE